MDIFQSVYLIIRPKIILLSLLVVCFSFARSQVISDVYRKKFYTQIPPTWIPPKQKLEIVKKTRKHLDKDWVIQQVKIENVLPKKEIKALKCHPPFSMKITSKKPQKPKKAKRETPQKKLLITFLLIVYPRSYRNIIEDPFEPPPIDYLGSTELLAFYFYKPAKKSHKKTRFKMAKKMSGIFYLK
ncbi:hypothetical protein [Candidatus Uabimicrobium sp. HlEnr_7]|uniref:hypothetical protein n=1 Tax=Candidatus Uabimicrobium helgolandensis TaxID=3095367 RepID=UPI00355677EA